MQHKSLMPDSYEERLYLTLLLAPPLAPSILWSSNDLILFQYKYTEVIYKRSSFKSPHPLQNHLLNAFLPSFLPFTKSFLLQGNHWMWGLNSSPFMFFSSTPLFFFPPYLTVVSYIYISTSLLPSGYKHAQKKKNKTIVFLDPCYVSNYPMACLQYFSNASLHRGYSGCPLRAC